MNTLTQLQQNDAFIRRHNGPSPTGQQAMLDALQLSSLEGLIQQTVPEQIRLRTPLALAAPVSEQAALMPCVRWLIRIPSTNPISAWAITTPLPRR
ncbi:MAG: hypothetical protein R3E95_20620 [Thiolinea sp.]